MARKGIKGISLDDIASDLGISKKTIYQVYASKEDLSLDMVKARMKEIEREIEEIRASPLNPFDKIARILIDISSGNRPIISSIDEMRRIYPQIWESLEQWRMSLFATMVAIMNTGMDEGTVRREANVETAVKIIFTFTIFNLENVLQGKEVNIDAIIRETIDIVRDGIAT